MAVKLNCEGNTFKLQEITNEQKRWLESRIMDFDYNKQFGGVIYIFLRGVREGKETGVYTTKPSLEKIDSLDKLLKNKQ